MIDQERVLPDEIAAGTTRETDAKCAELGEDRQEHKLAPQERGTLKTATRSL